MNFIDFTQNDFTNTQQEDFNVLTRILYKWAKVAGRNNMEHTAHWCLSLDVLPEDARDEDWDTAEQSRSFGGYWDDDFREDDDLIEEEGTEWRLFKTWADFLLMAPMPTSEIENDDYDKKKAGKYLNSFSTKTQEMFVEHGTLESIFIIMDAIRYAKTLKSMKMLY